MKTISTMTQKDKFNKFTSSSKDFFSHENISYVFPRYILYIFHEMEPEDIEEALRGLGSNDEGIDAFFVNENERKIYLCQFKSRTNFSAENYKEAKKEWFSLLDKSSTLLLQQDFKSNNNRINEIKDLIKYDYAGYDIEKIFYHMGFCSESIVDNYPSIKYVNQNEILERFVYFYEKDLDDSCAPDSIYLEVDLLQNKEINMKNELIFFTPKARQGNKVKRSLVFPINGEQVLSLLRQGSTILNRNVRGYLGDKNTVNSGIINTALTEPEFFYFFNNGISITCDSLDVKGLNNTVKKITLMKPQIINGAQTVSSLEVAYKKKVREFKNKKIKNPEAEAIEYMKNIHLVCKVMESNKGADTIFAKNLTTYNNTQNKIKPTDFYSNRPEQIMLKEGLGRYGIDYIVKRGKFFEENKSNTFFYKVNIEKLAEMHHNQSNLFSNVSNVFNEESEENLKKYIEIFGDNGTYNAEKILNLTETFLIYNLISESITYVKNIFNKIDELKNEKMEVKKEFVNKERRKFNKLTRKAAYLNQIATEDNSSIYIDNVVRNVSIMELKTLNYIFKKLYDSAYVMLDDEKDIMLKDYFQTLLKEKKIDKDKERINNLLEYLIAPSLSVYAKAIDQMLINDTNRLKKRHPKNNEAKDIIHKFIAEGISSLETISLSK